MKRTFALALAAAAITVAGCGSDDNSSSSTSSGSSGGTTPTPTSTAPKANTGGGGGGGGASSNLKLSADPSGQLKFDKSSLSAKAGNVTITMDNPSSVPHGVAVEGNGVDKDGKVVNKGGTSTVTVKLKPGKYEFYCPVPGHKQAGMEGDLTVK
jgi:plastocyanin